MVVCLVTRIKNETPRTFVIAHCGDLFYSPRVDGEALGGEHEIKPGAEAAAEDLLVPWESLTLSGLVIREKNSDQVVRCIVGPADMDDGKSDWLRLHGGDWQPIAKHYWLRIGSRHYLGAVGQSVHVQLTFVDFEADPMSPEAEAASARAEPEGNEEINWLKNALSWLGPVDGQSRKSGNSGSASSSAEAAGEAGGDAPSASRQQEPAAAPEAKAAETPAADSPRSADAEMHTPNSSTPRDPEKPTTPRQRLMTSEDTANALMFDLHANCASPDTVFLNVFDLVSATTFANSVLNNSLFKTVGAFHTTVEVYGEEWGFYKLPDSNECGVFRSRIKRRHPTHVFRQSLDMGATGLREWEVCNLIRHEVLPNWPSGRYDLLHCNCIHFCDGLLRLLGVEGVPPWVRGLHETGATLMRLPSVFSFGGTPSITTPEQPGGVDDDVVREGL
eukprot:TRINITY_DN35060_c0_g1_i1.p1 TRINITY_DN35060_c0_g1~~TRINITY_DN35060_c0_g1_i1.p1  ORF type:complete len:446 (+),score=71.05 TRINITY_DN35060_c0_g1_i1:104-1441(+)